jgi:hypothetical protein
MYETKKEKPAEYDLFKDYYRGNKGKPDSHWDWDSWNTKYDYNVFTKGKQDKEVFEFLNKEVNHECNVPEPYIISMLLMGCCIILGLRKRL